MTGKVYEMTDKNLDGIIDQATILAILAGIKDQLEENAEQANEAWASKRADKIKLLSVSVALKRDKDGKPGIKIDFGYSQKVGSDIPIRQKGLPGM